MHVVHIISSLERGGAQAILYDLVEGLAQATYEQSIIYFHDGPYKELFAAHNIPLYRIGGFVSVADPAALYQLATLCKRLNPSLIHTVLWAANWMGRIVARQLAIPCIASLHNNYTQNGRVRQLLDRLVPFSNSAIIAVSDEVKSSFYRFQSASCPLIVIPNGIRPQGAALPPLLTRRAVGLQEDHFVIGSVGRFVPLKRYPFLLTAFAELLARYSQARLLLIGSGPQEKELKALARHLHIDEAIYWVINRPAQPYYPLMDCFVLTSLHEGISIALLEAMRSGVACAVTYASLQHPVIEHMRNGIVVSVDNATLLSQNLAFLMTNNTVRNHLSRQAQQTVRERFESSRMIEAYNRLFQTYCLEK